MATTAMTIPKFLKRKRGTLIDLDPPSPVDRIDWDDSPLPKGLEWRRVWFLVGPDQRDDKTSGRFYVREGVPFCGWGHVVVIRGEERSTLYDPYSMSSFNVPNDCAELNQSVDCSDEFRCGTIIRLITSKWEFYQSWGLSADLDMAAVILRKLKARIPTKIELSEERKAELARLRPQSVKKEGPSGGKPVADKILKPVKKDSKRGKVLEFFLSKGVDTPQSIREAMALFDTTRSNILSTLFILNKDNGLGYVLENDAARVQVPKGGLWI